MQILWVIIKSAVKNKCTQQLVNDAEDYKQLKAMELLMEQMN